MVAGLIALWAWLAMSAGMIPCTALLGTLSLLLMTPISAYLSPDRLRQGHLGFVPGGHPHFNHSGSCGTVAVQGNLTV